MGWSGQGRRASNGAEMKSYTLLWFWPWLQAEERGGASRELQERMRKGRRRRCKKNERGGVYLSQGRQKCNWLKG